MGAGALMKTVFKVSGKKWEAESESGSESPWSFDLRPGGWVLAFRRGADGHEKRVRFRYSRAKGHFFAKFAQPKAVDFFGERIQVSSGVQASSSGADYTAQFPGKVRKISVSEGASVKAGAPLLMVEAMKMEFAIKAGSDGKVLKILVEEGMQLSPGQELLIFEEHS